MAMLKPCINCGRRLDCPIREEKSADLRGTGITHATIKCDLWRGDFLPGERVSALVWDFCEDGGYGPGSPFQDYRDGTVLRIDRGKFLVQLDEPVIFMRGNGEEEARTQRVRHKDIRALDETPRQLCECGYVKQPDEEPCQLSGLYCVNKFGASKAVRAAVAVANRSPQHERKTDAPSDN